MQEKIRLDNKKAVNNDVYSEISNLENFHIFVYHVGDSDQLIYCLHCIVL